MVPNTITFPSAIPFSFDFYAGQKSLKPELTFTTSFSIHKNF
jgi:hypothetical protein